MTRSSQYFDGRGDTVISTTIGSSQFEATGWHTASVRRLFHIVNGSTPDSGNPEYWDGDIIWITPADLGQLSGKEISNSARKITRDGYQSCGTTITPPESLIISTRAPIGHMAITTQETCTNQGCKTLVARGIIDIRFFYYLFLTRREELQSSGSGSTFMELSADALADVKLTFPPVNEQRRIADYLEQETAKIDALIEEQECLVKRLNERRHALIAQAVGRTDAG